MIVIPAAPLYHHTKEIAVTTQLETWLAKTTEEPIDPDLPICDPHHHLWDRPDDRYLLEDLLQDTGSGHNIVDTVFVECSSMYRTDGPVEMQPVGETEFVQGVAEQNMSGRRSKTAVNAGIVGFADLTLGSGVAKVLEAHMAASPDRFRGIRHASIWHADRQFASASKKELLPDRTFREGFGVLGKFGLSFDACLYHPQITELADLATANPDVTVILDHIGFPLGIGPYAGQRDEVFQEWKRSMTALAASPNVVVKLGGLGMPMYGNGWHELDQPPGSVELAEGMEPYFFHCIEQFGVDRCMFESNFPVDKVSYSYNVMWNAFKRVANDFSAEEKKMLFHDTAARVYRL